MSYTGIIITLLLIIVDELFAIVTEDVTSVCGATTNAIVGKNASITCEFGTDISKLRSDVRVFHYRQVPEMVLECLWNNGKPKVTAQPGYEFNGNITTSLLLVIHHVTQDHAGVYACRVSKSSKTASKPCKLEVTAMDDTAVTVTSPKTFNDSSNAASPEDEKHIIVPIMFGGGVVVLIIFIIFKHKTLRKQFHKSCCLTDKFHIATNDPPPQQQAAQVPSRKCANGVEDGSVLTPLCDSTDIHMKNTTT